MIRELPPDRYLDEPYGQGIHVVLLHLRDELYFDALGYMKVVETRLHGSRILLWSCHVQTDDDAELVQACKFPQFRFLVNGNEQFSHIGVLTDRELIDRIYRIEDR